MCKYSEINFSRRYKTIFEPPGEDDTKNYEWNLNPQLSLLNEDKVMTLIFKIVVFEEKKNVNYEIWTK